MCALLLLDICIYTSLSIVFLMEYDTHTYKLTYLHSKKNIDNACKFALLIRNWNPKWIDSLAPVGPDLRGWIQKFKFHWWLFPSTALSMYLQFPWLQNFFYPLPIKICVKNICVFLYYSFQFTSFFSSFYFVVCFTNFSASFCFIVVPLSISNMTTTHTTIWMCRLFFKKESKLPFSLYIWSFRFPLHLKTTHLFKSTPYLDLVSVM